MDSLLRLRLWTKAAFGRFGGRRSRAGLLTTGLAGALLGASAQAALSEGCKPSAPKPAIVLKDMGPCSFDPQSMSFRGEPVEQAKCLMRGMDATRNLSPALESLPPALASRIGADAGLPAREVLSAFLSKQDLEWDFAAHLWQPLSRANDNDSNAPIARYFVIHDTSGPSFGRRPFPADIDVDRKINNLENFKCPDGWGKAHVVVNRSGGMLLDHEFGIPWRETKFERAVNFAGALKGLFVHVEMIQPRRSAGRRWRNDAQTPNPSFTAAQYDRLALLYVIASVRAEHWLIPAFHAAIDANIRNGHDDPLNFDVESFANSLDGIVEKLQQPEEMRIAKSAPAGETDATAAPSSSAIASTVAAATTPSTPGAIVKADAAAQPSAETAPQGAPETKFRIEANAAANAAPKSETKSETGSERKERERETVSGEHCKTYVAKGHRRRLCRTGVAEARGRGKRAYAVRPVDRSVSQQGFGAWHYRGDVRTRHARGASRHGRA